MSYDARDDAFKSYEAAIDALRAKHLKAKKVVRIGDCELILGDCLEVMPQLGKADAVVTDPPYGMEFRSNFRTFTPKFHAIANDDNADLLRWACELKSRHSAYVWCRWDNLQDIPRPRSLVTWVKNNWSMGDLKHEHARQTEVCAFYRGEDHFFPKGRPQDVVRAAKTGNELHPTQKPVPLMRQVIEWTYGVVCDPFMGSGTTGVACVQLQRKFIGIELDETYFDIACKRIEEAYKQPSLFPAEKPKPAKTGELFGEDAA